MYNIVRKSSETMHNVIKKIKPNDAHCYQRNQAKRCIMLKLILEGI